MLLRAAVHVGMALAFTALGLLGGWTAWRPRAAPAAAAAPHAHAPAISKQARRNLGLETGPLRAASWSRTAAVPAAIEELPGARVTVRAPAAGTVGPALCRAGAVAAPADPLVTLDGNPVPAPAGAPDWDIVEIAVREGDRVEPGAPLAVLRDLRRVRLRAAAAGDDAALLLRTLAAGTPCDADPLLAGTGRELKALRLLQAEDGGRQVAAVAEADNAVLALSGTGRDRFRTWALRPGTRYALRIPVEAARNAWIVPADAVADDGPDKVVFLEDGEGFLSRRVVVVHRDAGVAVLDPKSSELFPGDVIVTRGAPGLALALRAGLQAAIGHGHTH